MSKYRDSQEVIAGCMRRVREDEEALAELEAEVQGREPTEQERQMWIAYKAGIEQSRQQIDAELRLIARRQGPGASDAPRQPA
jgi:hypothetical protein